MSRSFRIYQKKRGDRRTGSGSLARLGETLFFGLFFLGGCGGLVVVLATLIVPQWRVNNEFVETTCRVREKTLAENRGDGGWVYRPEIVIDYVAQGKSYRTATYDIDRTPSSDRDSQQAVLDQFEVGKQYRCWYDPLDPQVVVLVRGYQWWTWLLLVVPISFILIGGGGFLYRVWHWGKSPEHRAAAGPAPIRLPGVLGNGSGQATFPTVPPVADMSNSPGTTLRFRLPISRSASAGLWGLAIVAAIWNSVAVVLVVDVIRRFVVGRPNWIETGVVAPLAVVGAYLVYAFFRQLLLATGIGPTLVEISDHPLRPAGKYELFLSQAGRLRLRSLELSLVGTEEARYRQGTDTRTESRCVERITLFRQEGFEVRGAPMEARCEMELPAGIMHSFKSQNNSLQWALVVEGKVAGWPDYRRVFPVVICPDAAESSGGNGA